MYVLMNVWPRSQPKTTRVDNGQVVVSFALTLWDEPSPTACSAQQNGGIYLPTGKFAGASLLDNLSPEDVSKRYFVHYCTMEELLDGALKGRLGVGDRLGQRCGHSGVSRGSVEVISRYVYASCLAPSPSGWQPLAFCESLRRASCVVL